MNCAISNWRIWIENNYVTLEIVFSRDIVRLQKGIPEPFFQPLHSNRENKHNVHYPLYGLKLFCNDNQ